MPDFEPDKESISRAELMSSRLAKALRIVADEGTTRTNRQEYFSKSRYLDESGDVPVGDVVTNTEKIARDFALAKRWGGEVLCMKLGEGEIAPISIREYMGGPFRTEDDSEDWFAFLEDYYPFAFPTDRFASEIMRRRKEEDESITIASLSEAVEHVERGLRGFLSYRFAGFKKWGESMRGNTNQFFNGPSGGGGDHVEGPPPMPAAVAGGGLRVTVSCQTHGLRIHVSPAYFISWIFFGSPTTPVSSYVLPGRYVFAGDGPMAPKRTHDNGVFSIPPSHNPALTRF